ncbi:MAG: NAD-dependent epimerase/dehydratase family protein [Pseudomonadota bacterium]
MLEHGLTEPQVPARTVVVGAGGFVGGAIARSLEARGANVVRLGRGVVDLAADGAGEALAGRLSGDDAVVLVSALAPVKNVQMLGQNIRMIEAMAHALADAQPAYVLNIGSDAVFGDTGKPLHENSPKDSPSFHGIMHHTREVAFAEAQKGPFATLRPTLIYGADDPHNGYGPNRFRRLASQGDTIKLFGEGEERRDHVWVEDVAELAARMVLHRSTGSLNAVSGQIISFNELAQICSRLHGPVEIENLPRSGPMPHDGYRPFDASAISAAFPDVIMTPPEKGLEKVASGAHVGT